MVSWRRVGPPRSVSTVCSGRLGKFLDRFQNEAAVTHRLDTDFPEVFARQMGKGLSVDPVFDKVFDVLRQPQFVQATRNVKLSIHVPPPW